MKQTTLKLFVLSLFLLAGGLFFIRGSHAQQQGDKPAEQNFKNIQVLKGMPSSQLGAVMNFISSALGVECNFCHVPQAFDKDDKPAKVTARKMMLMQFAINKDNKDIFGATGGVTCFTCHRGQTKPQVMPALPQAMQPGGEMGAAKAAADLPTVDQVLAKYMQAIGGEASYRKIHSRMMKGTMVTMDGTAMPIETYEAAPDKLVTITTQKQGVSMSGYNGKVGWMKGPRGQRELSGPQLAAMKRSADFYGDIKLKEQYPGLEVVDREKVGERDAIVLASQASPSRIEKLYFDAQTGLLIRYQTITETPIGGVPDQFDFEDFRDVDGVKMPFTIRHSPVEARDGWSRKYTEIKQNVDVDEAKFNPPPAAPPAAAPTPTPK
jgi:hypothetical protein